MSNTFNKTTMVWEVSGTGTLVTDAPGLNTAWVTQVVLIPNASNDAATFQDSASADAIYLKAGASDKSPVRIDFQGRGKRIYGLKCSALSTSAKAYVYLG